MWIRRLSTVVLIIFVGSLIFIAAYMAAGALPVQDLAQYWSAAHLVRHNPYSPELVAEFQHSQGIYVDPPLVLKNPPWAIPFILPLRWFGYRAAFAFWTVVSLIVLMGCTHAIWRNLSPNSSSFIPLLMPILFGPAIVQLMLGQWTILVFLGVAIFLIAAERGQDWIAGAALVLVLGKPHVALLFLLAVALWTVHHKRWRVWISGTLALLAASLIVELLNPSIWAQFLARTALVVHEAEAYPNLGGALFATTGIHSLALIPQIAGLIWLAWYWKQHRNRWTWWEHGTLVLLCSIVCSYYSYPYDEILALPALLLAAAQPKRRAFLAVFLVTELGYALYITDVAGRLGYGYMFLCWTASGWLIACILARSQNRSLHRAA